MQDSSRKAFSKPTNRLLIGYAAMLGGVVLAYLAVRALGNQLSAQVLPAARMASLPAVHVNDFLHVLLALALVIATARSLGALCRLVQQPPVIGEMVAGIVLGPSVLGQLAPGAATYILPQSIAPLLNVIAQFGVILYMFIVGLDLDLRALCLSLPFRCFWVSRCR